MELPELTPPSAIADRILNGDESALDAGTLIRYFAGEADVHELISAADRVRRRRFGNKVHLCSIVNAKQGGCPEDCGFCSQSKHHSTSITPEKFITKDEAVSASEKALSQRATALGLVTATRGLENDSKALQVVKDGIKAVRDAGHTEAHASVGFLTKESLKELKDAGLTELNHNLETGRGYFEKIVSTHTYDERIETIKSAKELGLRTCVGGIMGMGESPEHRAELALQLRELDVDEVPLNFLVGIEGTALPAYEPLPPMEMLRIIACFRLALPRQNIFLAAGRDKLGQLMPMMFSAGASGMMIGDFLTTANRGVQDDLDMIDQLGLETQVLRSTETRDAKSPRCDICPTAPSGQSTTGSLIWFLLANCRGQSNQTANPSSQDSREMLQRLSQLIRIPLTGLAFLIFAIGSAFISWMLVPRLRKRLKQTSDPKLRQQTKNEFFLGIYRWLVGVIQGLGLIRFSIPELPKDFPHDRPYVVIANHPTLLDVLLIKATVPGVTCLVKASLFQKSNLRNLLTESDDFPGPDRREQSMGTTSVLDTFISRLQAGFPVLVFPEGTRSPVGKFHRFRRGGIEAAVRACVPVVPLYIHADPPFLLQGQTWYHTPKRRPRFEIEFLPVCETISSDGQVQDAKELTAKLVKEYKKRLEQSEQTSIARAE